MVDLGTVLLDHGADINSRDSNHWTPLHAASIGGHLEMCMLLLNRGADVTAQSQDGNLPLHYLARCPSLASLQPEMYLRVCRRAQRREHEQSTSFVDGAAAGDRVGSTLLTESLIGAQVLLGMLRLGANINQQNRQGGSLPRLSGTRASPPNAPIPGWPPETPLHEASFRGTVDCVRFFIKYSTADVNMRTRFVVDVVCDCECHHRVLRLTHPSLA